MERVTEPVAIAAAIGIFGTWAEIGIDIQILAISGLAGAVFRALIVPEGAPVRRALQAAAGLLSAVFLGGAAAQIVPVPPEGYTWALMGSGFMFGAGGEMAVKAIQDRFYKEGEE